MAIDLELAAKALRKCHKLSESNKLTSLATLLPILDMDGKNMGLERHFQMAPMFKTVVPRRSVYMCARQTGKTASIGSQGILRSGVIPNFHTLFVHPRFDQSKYFSNTYVKPFLERSPIMFEMLDAGGENSILTRTLKNASVISMSYAFLDADRVRGRSNIASVCMDEVQDIIYELIPVIAEVTSANIDYGFLQFSGTPTTKTNTLARLFAESSQAEWHIKCGCGKENIPNIANDLMDMIQKTGLLCAKCGKALDPRKGSYIHHFPAKRSEFEGYHISQAIHPLHCSSKPKWKELIRKRDAYSKSRFMNEVLAEPSDEGAKPISEASLRACGNGLPGSLDKSIRERLSYDVVILGVDWSGFGVSEESSTCAAIVAVKPGDDRLHTLYCERLKQMSPEQEARHLVNLARLFGVAYIAHDFSGAGMIRETTMTQIGFPPSQLIPFSLVFAPASKSIINYYSSGTGRSCYNIDKTRSLMVMYEMLRRQKITLPDFERNKDVLKDLLNINQETRSTPRGSSFTLMVKEPKSTDDFAFALDFACSAIWHIRGAYPSMVSPEEVISKEDLHLMDPSKGQWNN